MEQKCLNEILKGKLIGFTKKIKLKYLRLNQFKEDEIVLK